MPLGWTIRQYQVPVPGNVPDSDSGIEQMILELKQEPPEQDKQLSPQIA
jgi:hypothetical protein